MSPRVLRSALAGSTLLALCAPVAPFAPAVARAQQAVESSRSTAVAAAAGASRRASDPGGLSVRATRRDTIVAASTVTAAFMVRSIRRDTVSVMPHVELPKDWTVLTGGGTLQVGPASLEMLILSVAVPSRAPAGAYPVRLVVTTAEDPEGVMDSVIVRVPARRGLDVTLQDRPGYVVSGRPYQATFLVRNRGNAPDTVRLSARSALSAAVLSDTVIYLDAEASRVVRVSSRTRAGLASARDDVLELAALPSGDSASAAAATATSSVRITVVPEPSRKIEEFQRLPTRVSVRAASSDGVSPFEISGGGKLVDGGRVRLDFLMRGPTGAYSAFGERDEYRFGLRAPSWSVRGGDQLFMLSSLTGSGQPGFGLGVDGERGMFSFGAYGQEFRRTREKGSESGLFLTAQPRSDSRFTLNVVDRNGGLMAGDVVSGMASLNRTLYRADVELARSQGESGSGLARSLRLGLGGPSLSLDLGHRSADTAFAGSQRGADHYYLTSHIEPREGSRVAFNVNGSRQQVDLSRSTGVPYLERYDIGSVAATIDNTFTIDAGAVSRATTVSGVTRTGTQNTLRGRTDLWFPFGTLLLELEGGRAHYTDAEPRAFAEASLGIRRALGDGSWGAYVERYSGGGVTKGLDPSTTVGGDLSLRAGPRTHVSLLGYGTRVSSAGAEWHSQLDALVSHTLPNGSSVSLRARLLRGGSLTANDRNVAYLEYGIPLSLPVSHLRTPGRVYGQVVDASTGEGVPNALVRLGPQVAITDRSGKVAFGGVPGGEHRLSMSQETSFANAVFVGDPTLSVDSLRASPTTFTLAIARSARVNIDVRRFAVVRTGVGGAPDSLADAGPLSNATLMLVSARDTLYRTTTATGKVSFRDIPPGDWVLTIRGDAPAQQRFEPDRMELTLAPGEVRPVEFHLLPRRRQVQIIGDEKELKATPAGPKSQGPASGTRTIKPNAIKQ